VSGIGDGALDHRRRCRREILERLFTERGEPAYIRSDNGPEFIAEAIKRWLAASGVKTLYRGAWRSMGERLLREDLHISRLRDELLEREVFANLKEAQVLAKDYRDHYNHHRPHGALGYLTPAEFAVIEALSSQSSVPTEELKDLQSVPRLSFMSGTENGGRSEGAEKYTACK
jgi:transposase InsO family protein